MDPKPPSSGLFRVDLCAVITSREFSAKLSVCPVDLMVNESLIMTIIRNKSGHRSIVDRRPFGGPALVTAAADADPVTLLVLGWLATKRSANTRAAYARDLGIAPARRGSPPPTC